MVPLITLSYMHYVCGKNYYTTKCLKRSTIYSTFFCSKNLFAINNFYVPLASLRLSPRTIYHSCSVCLGEPSLNYVWEPSQNLTLLLLRGFQHGLIRSAFFGWINRCLTISHILSINSYCYIF